MTEHIFLPYVTPDGLALLPEHEAWLVPALNDLEAAIERGDIAASMCLQGVVSELALYGRMKTDWIEIMNKYMVSDSKPVAYSEIYGKRLYQFADWLQTEVHAIHARWWIEQALGLSASFDYQALIEELIQPSGWIYNPAVSPTGLRLRMKSELFMSLAMGVEILASSGGLEDKRELFEGVLSAASVTGYLGAEHFRLYALRILDSTNLAPVTLAEVLRSCEVGEGYCDFDVKAKIDDYMGTAKRVGRDIPVHSALSSLHALSLSEACEDSVKKHVAERIHNFGEHLKKKPLDILAFKMRDIDMPFGTGLSALEVVAASKIAST